MKAGVGTFDHGNRAECVVAICLATAATEEFDIQAAGVPAPKLAPLLDLSPKQMGVFFTSVRF